MDVRLSAEGERLRINAPKGVLKHGLREQIAERKQELLEFLGKHQAASFVPPPIVKRTAHETAPLSFAQERLWFLEQLEPGNTVYNICRASRLVGQLNLIALEASLNEIVRRHEVLRSAIRVVDGRPAQIIQPPFELKIPVTDLRHLSNSECQEEISCQIQKAAESPFDFSCGKFLRAGLLRLGNDEQVLIITTHHIVSDAWSLGILIRELWSLYEGNATGNSPLEDLPIQYADFAVWQREWLQAEVLERQVAYWKEQLKELTPLSLPADRPRPARQSFAAVRCPITLSESLTIGVKELSNESEVTPFMILLAAFQVLLYRYCGQEDIVVGSAVANRARTELEPLVGFFINMLVLRSDLSGNPTFKELLARVREVCLGAYAHQDLPFEKLVQELQPDRDQSRNPLFQVMFVLQNATRPLAGVPGLRIETLQRENTHSQFDLSLFLRERDGKYIGYFEYGTDLFDRERIERMTGHLQTLLQAIITDPDQAIATLPILRDVERHQILVEWNDTAADYPKDKRIHQLFEEQVERTPEAIAVEFAERRITYRELNRKANQLAHYLIGLGIGPEKLAGVCIERSIEMVVGLLGILKAGGAYVPLEPAYPEERLRFMMEDARVSVLLTSGHIFEERKWKRVQDTVEGIENLDPHSSIFEPRLTVICLDRRWPLVARQSSENPTTEVAPQNLAYVIYTSGSTGQPKGVAIEHRNTCNLLYWANSVYAPEELNGVLASTSICFDLSVFELFAPLSWGGKIVLVENALRLRESSAANEIVLINTVPSVIASLLAAGHLPTTIDTVNLAGEPLRQELVRQVYDLGKVNKVCDLYGPSETTTYSTFVLRTINGPGTIGRPVSNTQIYILDKSLQLVPIGVRGEIYIGGAGVGRGYLNRPDLTSEKFIANPLTGDGSVFYRTGDLARYLPDGNIEFIGRADNQVKIRGHRIELGEIESVINQYPGIKESVVVAGDRETSNSGNLKSQAETGLGRSVRNPKSLIAYFVPRQRFSVVKDELQDFLKQKLPDYMVPSIFVELEALPLSRNGKINRQALAATDHSRPELREAYVEPATHTQEVLAQIWSEVLKIEAVGIHDNFFKLGGHSLLAIQIIARMREVVDKDVALSALFETPTIAGLAASIEKAISVKPDELPPIVPVPRNGPLPLSMNQEHLWRLDRLIPGTHFFNMPYVYRLTGDLKVSSLEKTVQEIIDRHEALRTVFTEARGRPVQIVQEVHNFQLPVVDLRGESNDEVSQEAGRLVLEERQRPFDLKSGPLVRIKLLRLTNKEYLLLVTLHHIISDHWSMGIFRRELAIIYEAFSRGGSHTLPCPVIQFADFASWERRLLKTGLFHKQLAYWTKQLAGPSALVLRYTCEQQGQRDFRTARREIEIDQELFAAVKVLADKTNVTPFMVILSALSATLHACTGQTDIRIGALVANRSRREIEGAIGHFLNTVVLRVHIKTAQTLQDLLNQVREVVVAAFSNQELPYEVLAQALEQKEGPGKAVQFKILLNYQLSQLRRDDLTGISISPFTWERFGSEPEILPTSFDLIVRLRESSTKVTGSVNYKINTVDNHVANRILDSFSHSLKDLTMISCG